MKVTVQGAGEVTGSAYLLQTREANVLVDFGLFHGARKQERHRLRVDYPGLQETIEI
jgi:predicted metal-dependent RNase